MSCWEKWKNPERMKVMENSVRPASVTNAPTDAPSVKSAVRTALAVCERCEIELLAIKDPPEEFLGPENVPATSN
jgi:hypothetical protein